MAARQRLLIRPAGLYAGRAGQGLNVEQTWLSVVTAAGRTVAMKKLRMAGSLAAAASVSLKPRRECGVEFDPLRLL
jgi:hypothetical protein